MKESIQSQLAQLTHEEKILCALHATESYVPEGFQHRELIGQIKVQVLRTINQNDFTSFTQYVLAKRAEALRLVFPQPHFEPKIVDHIALIKDPRTNKSSTEILNKFQIMMTELRESNKSDSHNSDEK